MPGHLYIHVPFCDGKCHYCGFYSVVAGPCITSLYSGMPAQELSLAKSRFPSLADEPVRTLFMGGGTPAMLGADGLARLADTLAAQLPLDAIEEWTVELNPSSVSPELLKTLASLGVNRLSIGVQSFDDGTLARIGRRHSAHDADRAVRGAQDAGFGNTGIDLIAGLPGVDAGLWQATLEHALALNLTHLSVYALSLEPGTPLAAQAAAGLPIPGDAEQLAALAQAEALLCGAGFGRYEISNYALPGRECGHNLGIWRGNDYLGLGPAAASRVGLSRWTNSEDVSDYMEAIQKGVPPPSDADRLTAEDDACERALFALRLAEGLDPAEAAGRFPALLPRVPAWEERLSSLSGQGITERGGRRWRLTARGREVCDAVLRELV